MENIVFEEDTLNLENVKDYIAKHNIRSIFFAETHGLIPEIEAQEKIISKTNPKLFLYELLEEEKIISEEDYQKFLSKPDEDDFSIISKFKDLKPTVILAKKFRLPIVGCDIKNMLREDTKFRDTETITEEDVKNEENIMAKREERQLETINRCLNQDKEILLFVSLGAYHLRKESLIRKKVKSNYLLVRPLFDRKEINEVEDILNSELTFLVTSEIKIKND